MKKYAKEHMIKFNPDKCTLLIFSDPNFNTNDICISISGSRIKNVKKEKHLGHVFQNAENIIGLSSVTQDIKIRNILDRSNSAWEMSNGNCLVECRSLFWK